MAEGLENLCGDCPGQALIEKHRGIVTHEAIIFCAARRVVESERSEMSGASAYFMAKWALAGAGIPESSLRVNQDLLEAGQQCGEKQLGGECEISRVDWRVTNSRWDPESWALEDESY